MAKRPRVCFRLEATRGPHTGSTHYSCSESRSSSSSLAHPLSIGRKKCCWLRLPKDLEVSSVHAEFRFVETGKNEARIILRDVKSTNGTKVNGKSLKDQADYLLSDRDLIVVGRTSLRFVQVDHGQVCEKEGRYSVASTRANTILIPSAPSSSVVQSVPVPVVIELDNDEVGAPLASAFAGMSGIVTSSDKLENEHVTEPEHGQLKSKKDGRGMDNSRKEGGPEANATSEALDGASEEATCTALSVLDRLEQQVHVNDCIGGRVAVTSADVAEPSTVSAVSNAAHLKTRKRGGTEGGAKKSRKLKARDNEDDSAIIAPKTKRQRKRKRVDIGGDIVLALALTGTSKIDKEQQTDLQLAVTKKKIQELDEQMAKLAKRRVNLVKTLSRQERTKEKLRKSQVLSPAKVRQLLDLKAALNVIFPSNRQVQMWDPCITKKQVERSSVVATRYAPLRWSSNVDCDEEKHAELAAVAAISMWKRASQQLFGLQCDLLLYRNSVMRTFLGDNEDAECGMDGSIVMENGHNVDIKDTDAIFERKAECERKSELAPVLSNDVLDWTQRCSEVPGVVKRVFPNWQRDLAFLRDQPAHDIKMALEAMNDAQAKADAIVVNSNEVDKKGDCCATMSPIYVATESATPSGRQEQRLACTFMAQVMMQLIAEKTQRFLHAEEVEQQQTAIDPSIFRAEDCQQPGQQSVADVSENEVEEEPSREELPKTLVSATTDDIVQTNGMRSEGLQVCIYR